MILGRDRVGCDQSRTGYLNSTTVSQHVDMPPNTEISYIVEVDCIAINSNR